MIVQIKPTPPDCTLVPYDYSALTAIHTCDTYGILRYGMHKTFKSQYRAMSLEAGSACHEVFAADRIWNLVHTDMLKDHADYRGQTLFGVERWSELRKLLFVNEPARAEHLSFGIEVLETSGFYDDPSDNRRTLAKLTETCIAYMDRTSKEWPIYVSDRSDPTKFIGIECPFDFLITFDDGYQVRFIGRIDGLHVHDGDDVWAHENKTGSRMDLNWLNSFKTSHQVTGYCIFASALVNTPVRFAMIHGAAIPLPKSYDFGGIVREIVERKQHHIVSWERWVRAGVERYERWRGNPYDAPKCTHSCNRYYRTCQFIDFCASDIEDQKTLFDMMDTEKWSPLDEKSSD